MKDESLSARFSRIRDHYRTEMPKMMAEHARTGRVNFDPYTLDFMDDMTPIEKSVWCDIRGAGLPFLPQIPALRFFLDFADPFKKIAIECDGKAWHDAEADARRDALLMADGWTIYRIPGSKCNRLLPRPHELIESKMHAGYSEEEAESMTRAAALAWRGDTSEGIIDTIRLTHYARGNA